MAIDPNSMNGFHRRKAQGPAIIPDRAMSAGAGMLMTLVGTKLKRQMPHPLLGQQPIQASRMRKATMFEVGKTYDLQCGLRRRWTRYRNPPRLGVHERSRVLAQFKRPGETRIIHTTNPTFAGATPRIELWPPVSGSAGLEHRVPPPGRGLSGL